METKEKGLLRLIKNRKNFLAENAIQDWSLSDTVYVAEEFCKQKTIKLIKQKVELLKALNGMIIQFEGIEGYGSKDDAQALKKARKAITNATKQG